MTDAMRKARALEAANQQAAAILAVQDLPPGSLAGQWAAMVLKREGPPTSQNPDTFVKRLTPLSI